MADLVSRRGPSFALGLLVLLLLLPLAAAQLVGPGAMTQYSGGRNTQRGYGTVREPAEGFFIGGSTVKDMNGVYKRVNPMSVEETGHSFQLAYRKWPVGTQDDQTGWVMGLANAPEDGSYEIVGDKPGSEWLIVDP
eukprot:SAG31_NODE_18366_length_639_cov_0.666667_1_plen_135_part_01